MLIIKDINVFVGRKKIINNVSFQVKSGSIVGLIGPNGAGKTTIMKTILGLTKFTGTIKVNNQVVTENNHRALAKVGALIEHPAIYPFLTGTQNLKLYAKDVHDMDDLVALLEMNKYINNKSKSYSLGMKQKLGIAIALLNRPELVILDEPMNGLDIEATILVRKVIKKYAAEGSSFLISSHVLNELQKIMTDVVLISNGKLVVNESINKFKQLNQQIYQLLTEDMPKSITLIQAQKLSVNLSEGYLLVDQAAVNQVQDLLYENHIHLLELIPKSDNFEQIVINLLKNKEE
ncbi:ABC transporter ATP-binding protein [Dellaglioa sp. BT-FLS60]